ncbi:MAG: hypothetical protein WC824_07730 [Bacteroidota bacterium]|jgi:hypothetical protein
MAKATHKVGDTGTLSVHLPETLEDQYDCARVPFVVVKVKTLEDRLPATVDVYILEYLADGPPGGSEEIRKGNHFACLAGMEEKFRKIHWEGEPLNDLYQKLFPRQWTPE